MTKDHALAVFEGFSIRRIYDEKAETWNFSVVDIVAALIQQHKRLKGLKSQNLRDHMNVSDN